MKNFTIMATGPMPAMLAAIDALRQVGANIDDIDVCDDIPTEPMLRKIPANVNAQLPKQEPQYVVEKITKRSRNVTRDVYEALWKAHHGQPGAGQLLQPTAKQLCQWMELNVRGDLDQHRVGAALSRLSAMHLVNKVKGDGKRARWEPVGAAPVTPDDFASAARIYSREGNKAQKSLI